MKRLIFFIPVCLLVLCTCQNSLDYKVTGLQQVSGNVLFNSSVLKTGNDYSVGYGNGNIRSDRIHLTWQKCVDKNFLSYKLFRDGINITTIINATSVTYTDSLLMQNTEYNYRLVCCLQNGMAVEDTISIKTPLFLPPTQFQYEFLTPTSLLLSWENNAESSTGCIIERFTSDSDTLSFESSVSSFTDNNIIAGTEYFYRVKAYNSYESTDFSAWIFISDSVVLNFEDNDGGFTSNDADGWQWGHSTMITAHSGANIWGAPLNTGYPNNANYQLTSPLFTIGEDAYLSFYHAYSMESGYDGGNVKISFNNGATWNIIHPDGGYPDNSVNSSGEPGYTNIFTTIPVWHIAQFNLSDFVGLSVMFKWTMTTDNSVTGIGWFIDDLVVTHSKKAVVLK